MANNTLQQLMNQYQQSYDQAKAANQNRYDEIKNYYFTRQKQGQGYIDAMSNQSKQDLANQYQANLGHTDQSLISRGLGNTTVKESINRGLMGDYNAELRRLNDATLGRRLSTFSGLSGDTLGFMERRNDAYPDMGMLSQLAMAQGAGSRPAGQVSTGGYVGPTSRGGGGGSISRPFEPSSAAGTYNQPDLYARAMAPAGTTGYGTVDTGSIYAQSGMGSGGTYSPADYYSPTGPGDREATMSSPDYFPLVPHPFNMPFEDSDYGLFGPTYQ